MCLTNVFSIAIIFIIIFRALNLDNNWSLQQVVEHILASIELSRIFSRTRISEHALSIPKPN